MYGLPQITKEILKTQEGYSLFIHLYILTAT